MTPSLNARSGRGRTGRDAATAEHAPPLPAEAVPPVAEPASPLPTGRIGPVVRRRPTPDSLPLWRDVLELEEVLRPQAYAELRAQRRLANPWAIAALLTATIAGVAFWAVALQRQDLVQTFETMGRPTWTIPSLSDYVTAQRVAEAWAPITIALAIGVALAIVGILLPATRRFTLRHPVAPVVAGAGAYLGILQLLLVR